MRIIAILILIIFAFSFVPVDVFVVDHGHVDEATHQCALVCHAGCHSAIIPVFENQTMSLQVNFSTLELLFSYNNPSSDPLKRPPVFSAKQIVFSFFALNLVKNFLKL